jgi:hypothetical protein
MNAHEPQKRRRGFFLHSDGGEPDSGDHENAEGYAIRTRSARSRTPRQFSSSRRAPADAALDEGRAEIRSGSVTGSRQRGHLPR